MLKKLQEADDVWKEVIQWVAEGYYSQFFSLTYFQKLRLSSFQENDRDNFFELFNM